MRSGHDDVVVPGRSSRDLIAALTAVGLAFTGTATLGAAVPKLTEQQYGVGYGGIFVAAFMLSTVAAQLLMPSILTVLSAKASCLLATTGLICAPLVYLQPMMGVALLVTALRGFCFGVITVDGPLLTAVHSTTAGRGRAMGIYGFATTIGAVVATPLGVSLVDDAHGLVVLMSGSLSFAAWVVCLTSLAPDRGGSHVRVGVSVMVITRSRGYLVPFFLIAAATGVTLSYVALLTPTHAAAALLVGGIGKSLGRFIVGPFAHRHRIRTAMYLALSLSLVGQVAIASAADSVSVVPSAFVAGVGSGAVASVALIATFASSEDHEFASCSTAWNLAFNGGMAMGALGCAAVLFLTTYRGVFVLTAILVAAGMFIFMFGREARQTP
jgi:MFS family permease